MGKTKNVNSNSSLLKIPAPKFKHKVGYGVAQDELVEETSELKKWRKKMLVEHEALSFYGKLNEQSQGLFKHMFPADFEKKRKEVEAASKKKWVQFMPKGSNPFTMLTDLSNSNTPHLHSCTSTSTIIETVDKIHLFLPKDFSNAEMQLRKKLKKEIAYNIETKNLDVPHYTNEDSDYMVYDNDMVDYPLEFSSTNIREFDISKAYYNCAYQLGYIGEEMYKKCIDLPKHIRLRFMGSIATFKRHYAKSGWTIEGYFAEKNPLLRRVWFHIVKHVDDCLKEFKKAAGANFLLYYVDGIYVRRFNESGEEVNWQPILDALQNKYGFVFNEKKVFGFTRTIDAVRKNSLLYIYKFREKDDMGKRKINIFGFNYGKNWVRKDFNIPKATGFEADLVPQWQVMLNTYYESKQDLGKTVKKLNR